MMNWIKGTRSCARMVRLMSLSIAMSILIGAVAIGHGRKEKGNEGLTPFQALRKATQLYDRLLSTRRLGESWEKELAEVKIGGRKQGDVRETVVSFHRLKGEPKTVYIFFSGDGKYAGSNFSGQ